jgi:cytoskeleton protein RodZ
VEKSEEAFVKPAEVEKAATVGEDPPKAVVESKPSPKPELKPQPEEMNSGVLTSVGLGIEIEVASAELATTATPIPIKTVSSGSSRIKINAINNSWIQIRDDNLNTMLVTRLLAAGDSFAVPDKPGLVLLTGNAGALEIVVDDTIVPSIGGPGIVRRGVVLDVGRLKAGTAVSN